MHHPQLVPNANTVHLNSNSDYEKEGPICVYSPPKNPKSCCIEYSQKSGQCSKCAKGLTLDSNGLCKDIKIVGCLEKNEDGYGCANCAREFVLANGRCLKRIYK